MKKKYIALILVVIVFIACLLCILIPKTLKETNPYSDIEKISLHEVFNKDGHFFVYLYKNDCKFCKNITKDIQDFAKKQDVYVADTETMDGIKSYDWDKHQKLYDVEIGKLESNEVIFYNEKTQKDIEQEFPELKYDIVLADKDYAEVSGKKAGYVYAVSTHPVLNNDELQEKKLQMPGVPMILEIQDYMVVNYYFDDKEIIEFLNSDTKPINNYWNIDVNK